MKRWDDTPTHQRAMAHWKAGGYDIDRREPIPMDLPEVCAFSLDGLLENVFMCRGGLVVVRDVRFGPIPVCASHRRLIIKECLYESFEYIEGFVGSYYWTDDAYPQQGKDRRAETAALP